MSPAAVPALCAVTPEQARALTDRIKVTLGVSWELITEAYKSRAHAALGYANWDDYCTREFGTSRLRLPREERSETVASLRESGLSIRAIASATGDHYSTVSRELARGVANATPALATSEPVVADLDETDEDEFDAAWADAAATEPDDDEPALTDEECEAIDREWSARITELDASSVAPQPVDPTPPPRITGTDGKTYPKPAPKTPNRRALTDAARDAGWDLRKAVEKIDRLINDDRFTRNREEVATQLRSHLTHAVESCQGFLDQLPGA